MSDRPKVIMTEFGPQEVVPEDAWKIGPVPVNPANWYKADPSNSAVQEQTDITGSVPPNANATARAVESVGGEPPENNPEMMTTGSTDDAAAGLMASMSTDMGLRTPAIGAGPPTTTTFSGENWAGVQGQDHFKTAFEAAPQMAQEGLQDAAAATQQYGDSLAAHYKQQSEQASVRAADVQRRREQNDAELLKREEELKTLTQKYSQDLADTGKFWQKPQNILAAIAYSFMPLAGGAPDSGVRLIDQAIQQDFMARRESANMNLAGMRSNIAGYRAIAKDQEAGDLLAQSEAYRIAALQVEQIGASFQGAKAKAAAKTMIADLMQKSNLTAAEFFRRYVYVDPRVEKIPVVQEYMKQPGFVRYGQKPGETGTPSLGLKAMPQGSIGGVAAPKPVAKAPTAAGGQAAEGSDLISERLGPEAAKLVESRLPGFAPVLKQAKALLNMRVSAKVGPGHRPGDPAWLKAEDEIIQQAKAGQEKIAALTDKQLQDVAAFARFQQRIARMEAAYGGDTKKINKVIGILRGPLASAYQKYEDFTDKAGLGLSDAEAKVAMEFRQILGKNVNDYFKATSGGAVSESEQERLNQLISMGSSWDGIKTFANEVSTSRAKQFMGAVMTAGGGGDELTPVFYLQRMGQRFPSLNSPGKAPKKGK